MLVKQAQFFGMVKQGQDKAMRIYVTETLAPLWRQFTGASRVEVFFGLTQDPKGPEIPLVLSIAYEGEAKIEEAMASPARLESRNLLADFYKTYWLDVRLVHTTYEVLKDR